VTLEQFQSELTAKLKESGLDNPAGESRRLAQACLNLSTAQVIAHGDRELEPAQLRRLREWGEKRAQGMPLAYLAGIRGFYKDEFLVEPGVLIPRPETELVVETALKMIEPQRIADYGAGSGCIGLSLLREAKKAVLWSIDSSPQAIALTLKNAAKLNLAERTQVILSQVETWQPPGALDLIVANPPYIAEGDKQVEAHVHKYEPHSALYSGPDGLVALRAWIPHAFKNLRAGGVFVTEIGAGQSPAVREIMSMAGFTGIEVLNDLAGLDRVVAGRKK
jgi:release factor glutamine methyltransferase